MEIIIITYNLKLLKLFKLITIIYIYIQLDNSINILYILFNIFFKKIFFFFFFFF